MNKMLIGLVAGTSLAMAGAAFAQSSDVGSSSSSSSSKSSKSVKKSEKGTGGSAMGTSSETMGAAQPSQGEITGPVIEKKGSTVYVQDKMGAVVPLKTDKATKFEGITRNQLKEGDEIRASFDVRHKTENLAKSISLEQGQSQGTGGASNLGKEGSPSEEKGETPMQEQQEQKKMEQPSGSPSNQPSNY